ncbi:hypothetical protein RGU70_08070 [Herbaspirillum sp. RTI4]|uniref:hypothetical protein n=1 Tax=Herbaspirillum sp. RTI4 TaxID=3048640 RepID=UPI002AB5B423|nr:hypothetical protein [Herbaspirillum sp. RTI4]MDY7578275.1 hypothetical protein [Herbaspirillum sp. RTI4]MEA9981232.1 hypothetical protein [Herbaspirillum sp. RTI4]
MKSRIEGPGCKPVEQSYAVQEPSDPHTTAEPLSKRSERRQVRVRSAAVLEYGDDFESLPP